MCLPSNILAKLYLTGLAVTAACEPAHKPETCETKQPIVVEEDVDPPTQPAVAPRYPEPQQVQPQPSRPQPQPVVKKKPPKRQVWVSVCGHMELAPEGTGPSKCGMG